VVLANKRGHFWLIAINNITPGFEFTDGTIPYYFSDIEKWNDQHSFGRCTAARNPPKDGKVAVNQPVQGAINMGFADGHAANWKLKSVKNVVWHVGFTPNATAACRFF
jgi:prepilin-type processing-associated H-X9-DG protein